MTWSTFWDLVQKRMGDDDVDLQILCAWLLRLLVVLVWCGVCSVTSAGRASPMGGANLSCVFEEGGFGFGLSLA